ncbi:MAG: c-type cytochrome [Proteobacteria bacterium]|nr:c-type cytochrome [Pseudomonadota bacterium]
MQRKQSLKPGEKVLFAVFGAFLVLALVGLVVMEVVRAHMSEPMFAARSSFDLGVAGQRGSKLFREAGCTACHRAMRNGTNHGISLDGIGSRRSREWLEDFLKNPEAVYETATVDHGAAPKEAARISALPPATLHDIAVFLSELKAEQGSAMSRVPPKEAANSGFVQGMANFWAPEPWKAGAAERRQKSAHADAAIQQGAQRE